MTLGLEQNETIDLFKDEFKEFADEDSQIGQKADNNLKVRRSRSRPLTQPTCADYLFSLLM
jgi:hypothetical protein